MVSRKPTADSGRDPQCFGFRISSSRLPGSAVRLITRVLDRVAGFSAFNRIYAAVPACPVDEFASHVLASMGCELAVADGQLSRIPRRGPLTIVSNHPFGLMDGIILEALITRVRTDLRIMMDRQFRAIPEMRDVRGLFVDAWRNRPNANRGSWREALRWLRAGRALAVFPAGRVARWHWRRFGVTDPPWNPHLARFIRRTRSRVLPIRISGRNSSPFQLAGLLHRDLQNLGLIRQFNNKRNRRFVATIGEAVDPDAIADLDDHATIDRLRQCVEQLG